MIKFNLLHSLYLILIYLFLTFVLERKFHIKRRYYAGNPELKLFKAGIIPIIYVLLSVVLSEIVPSADFDGYINHTLLAVFIYFITPIF